MKKTFTLSQSLIKIAFIPLILILFSKEAHSQTTYYDNYAIRIPLTLNNASLGITTDHIKIVDVSGLVVKETVSMQRSWHANIGNLKPGTYLVQVINNNDKSLVGVTTFIKH